MLSSLLNIKLVSNGNFVLILSFNLFYSFFSEYKAILMKRLKIGPRVFYCLCMTVGILTIVANFFAVLLMSYNGFRNGYVNFFHEKKLWEFLKSKLNFLVLLSVATLLINISLWTSVSHELWIGKHILLVSLSYPSYK